MRKTIIRLLSVVLLLFVATTVDAQLTSLTSGKVYHFLNAGDETRALSASSISGVTAVATNSNSKAQQWYVTTNGNNYVLRNLATGRYLTGNTASTSWYLSENYSNTACQFTLHTSEGTYNTIRSVAHSSNGSAYMHRDGGNNIVGWSNNTSDTSSHWTITEVPYTTADLNAALEEVSKLVPSTELLAQYSAALGRIFTDAACTTLNSTYSSMSASALAADSNYSSLPAVLKALVDKLRTGSWAEENGDASKPSWSSEYAKKFRVQMYEPYSIRAEITELLGINAHNNMDNPTGLYADEGDVVYVIVDGTIEDGAELWLAHITGCGQLGHYNSSNYVQLHEGLNAIPYVADGCQLWVNYVVHTYDKTKEGAARFRNISDYEPLKIHIVGGHINGFFNAQGDTRAAIGSENNLWGEVDNDADWAYYKERVPLTSSDFTILGNRMTMQFSYGDVVLNDGASAYGIAYWLDRIEVPTIANNSSNSYAAYEGMNLNPQTGKINIMVEAWDRIMYSELATMGLLSKEDMKVMNDFYPRWTKDGQKADIFGYGTDEGWNEYLEYCEGRNYSEYFNHHGVALGALSGYMSGGWLNCNYNYNTMDQIIGRIAVNPGASWGPGHEIGHQHQAPFTLNGQQEVTNNLFSNVALWYMGTTTSRYNGNEGSLEKVLQAFNKEGSNAYSNNIWALTHLWYRLWMYYHLVGNNTNFWPRFYELCRTQPLQNGTAIDGPTGLLRLYSHACDAAGEDLTEFFRVHGYLSVMKDVYVNDYTSAIYNQSQEQIDAAIAAVKAKNYPENLSIIFICDDDENNPGLKHNGRDARSIYGETYPNSDTGCFMDFINETVASGVCTATVSSDRVVTINGGAGYSGYLVLNEKGEVLSFSNKNTFEVSAAAAAALASGNASIVSTNVKGETVAADVEIIEMSTALLSSLLTEAQNVISFFDETYTKPGFLKGSYGTALKEAIAAAEAALESGSAIGAATDVLYAELEKAKAVFADENAIIPFDASLSYIFRNDISAIYSDKGKGFLTINNSNKPVWVAESTEATMNAHWLLQPADEGYNLYNLGTSLYLPAIVKGTQPTLVSSKSGAGTYAFEKGDDCTWSIGVTPADEFTYLHVNEVSNIVGWTSTAGASRWYLESTSVMSDVRDNAELDALVGNSEKLINEVAAVEYKGAPVKLQADDASAAYYISSNATEEGHEPSKLLDNNVTSYFHTVWTGSSLNADHYLQIDMSEERKVNEFTFNYRNLPSTSWNVDAAKTIVVSGSNNLTSFTTIATLTSSDANNPLPIAKEAEYVSAILGSSNTAYRYLRFTVTNATGGKLNNHYYFGMSEFSLMRPKSLAIIKDDYKNIVSETTVVALADAIVTAKEALASGEGVSDATTALQAAYTALNTEFDGKIAAKKAELAALVANTQALINEIGVCYTTTGELALQAGDATAPYYVSSNADQNTGGGANDGGGIAALVNNSTGDYFHTRWGGTVVNEHHYIQLDLGAGNITSAFSFAYTARNGSPAPTKIAILGSNDGTTFTDTISIVTKDWAQYNNDGTYTSGTITSATPYRYIRFTALESRGPGNAQYGGYYFFGMKEFDFSIENKYEVNAQNYKRITDDMFIQLCMKNESAAAMSSESYAVSLDVLQQQIDALSAMYANIQELRRVDTTALEAAVAEAQTVAAKITLNDALNAYYADVISASEYAAFVAQIANAQRLITEGTASQSDFDAAEAALTTECNRLKEIDAADVTDRAALTELISTTNELVESVATMSTTETVLALQCADAAAKYYLYSNADGKSHTTWTSDALGVGALLDNEPSTHFHSTYQGNAYDDDLDHYLRVDMGEKEFVKAFKFNYVARQGNTNNSPTAMRIEGSNDGETFETITNLTMSGSQLSQYSSDVITNGSAYRYIRFMVTATNNNQSYTYNGKSHVYFSMSSFSVTACEVVKTETDIPAADIFNVYKEIDEAQVVISKYANEDTYSEAYNELRSAYIELNKYLVNKDALESLVADAQVLNSKIGEEGALKAYYSAVITTDEYAAFVEKISAAEEVIASDYVSQADVDAAADALAADYEALNTIVAADVLDRATLSDLIAQANALIAAVPSSDNEVLATIINKVSAAEAAVAVYMTAANYETLCSELNDAYIALDNATTIDKSALESLVGRTSALKDSLYIITVLSYTATEVAMQCDSESEDGYLYCNAPETNASWATDNVGVVALLNENESDFLHTEYGGDASADGLDHYLRVDLGENNELAYVEFSYLCRSGYTGLLPRKVVVEATNSLTGEWVLIKKLDDQPQTTSEVKTGCLGNGTAYRYWRFMVTATHGTGTSGDGHPYFAISDFNIYECTNLETETILNPAYATDIYLYNTNELISEVEGAITSANEVCTSKVFQDAYDAELVSLQAVYNKLAEAIKYAGFPVKITADEANPVLYNIYIKRTADVTLLQYAHADSKVSVVNKAANNSWQAWYFMQSEDGCLIKPYNANGKVLGANDTSNAAGAVMAAEKGEQAFDTWKFVKRADGYYNIQLSDGSNYFSNNGGTDQKMGFWNGNPAGDGGTLFKFVEAAFDNNNARYYQLSDVQPVMSNGSEYHAGTGPGLYSGVYEYRDAYAAAGEFIQGGNTLSSDECYATYKNLFSLKDNIALIKPSADKIYYIKSVAGDAKTYCDGKYVRTDYKSRTHSGGWYSGTYNHANLVYDNMEDIDVAPLAMFQFEETDVEGEYKMKNLHTGLYVKSFAGAHMGTAEEAQPVKFTSYADDKVKIAVVGSTPMHAQENYGVVVQWWSDSDPYASLWSIDEVTNLDEIVYNTSISKVGYSTLYLNYDVTIPEGCEAYYAEEIKDGSYVNLVQLDGVLPARTAAIIKSTEELTASKPLSFYYAGNDADAVENNMLDGVLYESAVEVGNNHIHMLKNQNNVLAMYWAYAEYNENCELSNPGTDDGGYVKSSANKAFLVVPASSGSASAYAFYFGGTTSIDEIKNMVSANGIYDLQGRKVEEITAPGYYVIDGKVVFVNEVK